MPTIGTPLSPTATRVLMCGSGELGKEVVIELQRYGVEVIAVDRYANAPAMQVAHRSHVITMLDGDALREVIEKEQPDLIVPEIEAIATDTLIELESEGFTVIPTARAARLTMNREGIRQVGRRGTGTKNIALSVCVEFRRIPRSSPRNRRTVCNQTNHEFIGQRAKHRQKHSRR